MMTEKVEHDRSDWLDIPREFFRAALAADEAMGRKTKYSLHAPIPVQFLVAHSIELILKAYLREMGVSLRELEKHFGHNLLRCLHGALERGLPFKVDPNSMGALEALNELHVTTQLRYIQTGAKSFPSQGPLTKLTKDLQDTISPIVGYGQKLEMFVG